jgi:phosphotransferase system IIA component
MFTEIDLQRRGKLHSRLSSLSSGTDLINDKVFRKFIKEDLHLEDNDLLRLLRVSKLDKLKKGLTLSVPIVVQNFDERIKASEKMRDETIKKIAKQMKKEGFNMESAF